MNEIYIHKNGHTENVKMFNYLSPAFVGLFVVDCSSVCINSECVNSFATENKNIILHFIKTM